MMESNGESPFSSHEEMYATIDEITVGEVPWQSFQLEYSGKRPAGRIPIWMNVKHEVWFRDPRKVAEAMLANPDFKGEIDWAPYMDLDSDDRRVFKDLLSGVWAWKQAVSSSRPDWTTTDP